MKHGLVSISAANRLATYDGEAIQFDADGNMTLGPLAGTMANFVFDSRNRLVSAGNITYRYDAENQRIGISTNGQKTSYVVNSQPLLSQSCGKNKKDDFGQSDDITIWKEIDLDYYDDSRPNPKNRRIIIFIVIIYVIVLVWLTWRKFVQHKE